MSSYIPNSNEDIQQMLQSIGIKNISEFFSQIPESIKLKTPLKLLEGLTEPDLWEEFNIIANKNHLYKNSVRPGAYYHYIPTIVDIVANRSEFYTAYTPYQAEMSQGFLQAIYEFQTAIARLTQMDVVNASMYDGASALAEAAISSTFITMKKKVIILEGITPSWVDVVKTYCWGRNIEFELISINELSNKIDDNIASVLFQSPSFFGDILDVEDIVKIVREKSKRALVIQAMSDPTCLGILKTPGESEIDIFVAEGQPLGNYPCFGGPNIGIFTAKKKFLRKIPGRIVGKTETTNKENGSQLKEGFVLTLQTREQHIRREKATSNICSNQGLLMLRILVYLVCLGKCGLKEIAIQNIQKTHYIKEKINNLENYKIFNSNPTYNQFTIKCINQTPLKMKELLSKFEENDIIPPLNLSELYPDKKEQLVFTITEMLKKTDLDTIVRIMEGKEK